MNNKTRETLDWIKKIKENDPDWNDNSPRFSNEHYLNLVAHMMKLKKLIVLKDE